MSSLTVVPMRRAGARRRVPIKGTPHDRGVLYLTVPDTLDSRRSGRELWPYAWESKGAFTSPTAGVAVAAIRFTSRPDCHLVASHQDARSAGGNRSATSTVLLRVMPPVVVKGHVIAGVSGTPTPRYVHSHDPRSARSLAWYSCRRRWETRFRAWRRRSMKHGGGKDLQPPPTIPTELSTDDRHPQPVMPQEPRRIRILHRLDVARP